MRIVVTAKAPRGYSLVEMMVVMMSAAFLLATFAGILHAMLRLERAGSDRLAEAESLARLARAFRRDAHAAATAEPSGPAALVFDTPGAGSAEYRVEAEAVVRKSRDAAGKDAARESYRLPPGSTAWLDARDEGGRRFASYAVGRGPVDAPDFAARAARVDAAVGLVRRLSQEAPR